mgnify:CR=1 FL=1
MVHATFTELFVVPIVHKTTSYNYKGAPCKDLQNLQRDYKEHPCKGALCNLIPLDAGPVVALFVALAEEGAVAEDLVGGRAEYD